MTDLSSDEPEIEAIADMAGELIHTKMEMARKDTQMVHVMRIGTFSIELVPAKDIDPEGIFNKILHHKNLLFLKPLIPFFKTLTAICIKLLVGFKIIFKMNICRLIVFTKIIRVISANLWTCFIYSTAAISL